MMKLLLLNPPNNNRIQRRYMCSYNAPNFLLPPQELLSIAGIIKNISGIEIFLIDSIAENLNELDTINAIKSIHPQVILSIQGFECFEEDIFVLDKIKNENKDALLVVFGHYATLFSNIILNKTNIDIIIKGEPDIIFYNLIYCLKNNVALDNIGGIVFKKENKIYEIKGDLRIKDISTLPMPAYELLKENVYFEPFLNHPFALIQSARGCPFICNYCVRSYGQRLTYKTTEQIIDEIQFLKEKYKIKSLRFIDDTFTVSKRRVLEICNSIIEKEIKLQWTCLSRIDTIDVEMISIMKRSGCKRIYFGIESGSKRILQYLNKEIDLENSKKILKACKENKIETFGFFIIGAPIESEADFNESINYAISSGLDYISVSQLVLYPGTELFENNKQLIDFSLLPYKNEWKDKDLIIRNKIREQIFYRRFYIRPRFVLNSIRLFLNNPIEYITNTLKLMKYIIFSRNSNRSDYF